VIDGILQFKHASAAKNKEDKRHLKMLQDVRITDLAKSIETR